MMTDDFALDLLRRHDPAAALPSADTAAREALRGRILASPSRARRVRRRRPLVAAFAVAAVVVLGAGAAWASGSLSPLALFRTNPQGEGASPGSLWHQHVVPSSVRKAATVRIPHVGDVQFWFARTRTHGWCGALRLPSRQWLATDRDPLDAGGAVPGCYPTRAQVNSQGAVYVLNGFDYQEDDVDARSRGGAFWRIEFGRVTIRGAVRVADTVSGRSAPVGRAGTFALAMPFADGNDARMHLVAYDAAGKVVGHA
jgi:hypothetical protein